MVYQSHVDKGMIKINEFHGFFFILIVSYCASFYLVNKFYLIILLFYISRLFIQTNFDIWYIWYWIHFNDSILYIYIKTSSSDINNCTCMFVPSLHVIWYILLHIQKNSSSKKVGNSIKCHAVNVEFIGWQ